MRTERYTERCTHYVYIYIYREIDRYQPLARRLKTCAVNAAASLVPEIRKCVDARLSASRISPNLGLWSARLSSLSIWTDSSLCRSVSWSFRFAPMFESIGLVRFDSAISRPQCWSKQTDIWKPYENGGSPETFPNMGFICDSGNRNLPAAGCDPEAPRPQPAAASAQLLGMKLNTCLHHHLFT